MEEDGVVACWAKLILYAAIVGGLCYWSMTCPDTVVVEKKESRREYSYSRVPSTEYRLCMYEPDFEKDGVVVTGVCKDE